MLKKSRRIAKSKDFQELFAQGQSTRFNGLIIRAVLKKEGPARFAVVVSKKVSLKATQRNRIKRLLRDALRKYQDAVLPGTGAAIIALPGFNPKSAQETAEIVRGLFKKASLLS